MKTKILKTIKLGTTMGLLALLGCSNQSAQQAPRPVVVSAAPTPAPAPVNLDPAAAPVIQQSMEQAPPPSETRISAASAEIVKMAQAGVAENVMLSFIETCTTPFNLTADGIVYLNDLGIPSSVITAMNKRDNHLRLAGVPAAPVVATAPLTPPPAQPAPAVAVPAPNTEVSYFYDSLAPYGSWMYVADYGWCWRPTVTVTYTGWRPYCDSGQWYWSDSGWYWHSDYSWGWAPFHYGRWFHHGHAGWMWHPGTVWGPSWVSWRYQGGYCGWAPLPPSAHWSAGVGFTYHGSRVSVGFDFGLASFHYAWISTGHFGHHNPRAYCEPAGRGHSYYANSTVVNNYVVNNTTIINHGIGRDRITKVAGSEVRHVSIREQPEARGTSIRGSRIEREGSSLVAYRPTLPKSRPSGSSAEPRPARVEPSRTAPAAPATPRLDGGRGTREVSPGRSAPDNRTVTAPVATKPDFRGSRTPPASPTAPTTSVAPKANAPATPAPTPRGSTPPARPNPDTHKGATHNDPHANVAPTPAPTPRVSTVPAAPAPIRQPMLTPAPSAPPTRSAAPVQTAPRTVTPPPVSTPSHTRPETRSTPPSGSSARSAPEARPPATFRQQLSPAPRSAPAPTYSAPAPAPRSVPAPTTSVPTPAPRSAPAPTYSAPTPAPRSAPAPSYSAPAPSRSASSETRSSSPPPSRSEGGRGGGKSDRSR